MYVHPTTPPLRRLGKATGRGFATTPIPAVAHRLARAGSWDNTPAGLGTRSSPPSSGCIPAASVVTCLPLTAESREDDNCFACPSIARCLHLNTRLHVQSRRLFTPLHAKSYRDIPRAPAHSSPLRRLGPNQFTLARMRTALLLLPAVALAVPDFTSPFQPAQLQQSPAQANDTLVDDGALDLLKRQTGPNECASGYRACININQPGLCCRTTEVCSIDGAGHPACCPNGNACTGTIAPITQGTSPRTTGTQTTTPTGATTTITVTTGTSTDFVQGSTGAASWVPNTFFPFAYLPTTYKSAAACSSAYSRCQSDAARCTAALAGGQNFGVTVSAPNGGVTITAVPSVGTAAAISICSSLSQAACSGDWNVQACSTYGPGDGSNAGRCGVGRYGVGAGVALGVVGGMLR